MSSRTDDSPPPGRTSPAEFALGTLGALVVLGLLAFLIYQAVATRNAAPRLVAEVTGIEQHGGSWTVTFRVDNRGGETAEQVQVAGTLTRDGREVQQVNAVLSLVLPHSENAGALVFSSDPRSGELEVSPTGYSLP